MPYQNHYYHLHLHLHRYTTIFLLITFISLTNLSFNIAQSSSPSNDSYNGSPLPNTAIIIVAVIFIAGITVCYIRHLIACVRGYIFAGSHPGGGAGQGRRDPPRGLDPAVIATFPTFTFSDVKLHLSPKTTPLECAICLFEFVDQDLLRLLPTCSHVFHPHCIAPWFSSHSTCPVCRANLEIQVTPPKSLDGDPLQHQQQQQQQSIAINGGDESEPSNQEQITPHRHDAIVQIEETPNYNIINKSRGSFQRSHSTGHSLVENCERFTLRLPEEVRNKLMINVNSNTYSDDLSANSLVSPRFGYRAWSVSNTSSAAMSVKPDRWRFTMSPPFISRSGSSPDIAGCSNNNGNNYNNNNGNNNLVGMMRSPRSLFKSMKSPSKSQLNRVVRCDDIGERSSDKLWPNRTSQESELEHH
ncbi:E3 ubiquitin-protein ligase ATL6 [Bienertia sinuspersici]